jgi:hypothetical protein
LVGRLKPPATRADQAATATTTGDVWVMRM